MIVLRRVILAVPTALLIVTLVFSVLHLAPGDPVILIAGEGASPDVVSKIRSDLGLDRPLTEQFVRYLGRIVTGDLGTTLRTQQPVSDLIAQRLPNTLLLAITALLISVVVGTLMGVFTAVRYGTAWDFWGVGLATVFVSAPTFWLAMLLIHVFAVTLGILPAAGIGGPQHLVLPALALSAGPTALIARIVRSETLEALTEDYVRTARAKGLRERLVLSRHVLRNILLPLVTVVGLQFGHAFDGAVVTEAVFAWPGMGSLLINGIFTRDFPIVQGGLLVVGIAFVLANLVVDILYAFIDPRIRYR